MADKILEERIKQFEDFRCSYGCDELQNGAEIIQELQAENKQLKEKLNEERKFSRSLKRFIEAYQDEIVESESKASEKLPSQAK